MPARWRRVWLLAALGGGLLVGCEHVPVKPPYPPDPMFVTRKPVEGKAEAARPLLAHGEPAVPPLPDTALASAPWQRLATVKGTLVSRPAVTPEAVESTAGGAHPPSDSAAHEAGAAEESSPR